MFKSLACIFTVFLTLTFLAAEVRADSVTLNNLQVIPTPFSGFFPAFVNNLAINDSGSIAGTLLMSTVNPAPVGFVIPAVGAPIAIQAPGADLTYVSGINESGTVVGYGIPPGASRQGFTYSGGTFTPLTVGSNSAVPLGINNRGDITGALGNSGFLTHAGVTVTFNVPGLSFTNSDGVNDSDEVVGSALNSGGPVSGFLRQSDGTITILNFVPFSINDAGIIVGYRASPSGTGAIIEMNGTDYTFSIPGATYTDIDAINNDNEVVGVYGEGFNSYIFEGQLPLVSSTPEPAAEAGVGMLLLSALLLRRRFARN